MTLHQLAIFCEVVRAKSFARAAENLRICRPAVSTQIKALEAEIGHSLFLRKPHSGRIELTRAGELVFSEASKIFQSLDRLQTKLRYLEEEQASPITIAGNTTLGIYLLPKLLGRFHAIYPHFTVRIVVEWDSNAVLTGFRECLYDLAVVSTQIALPEAIQEFVFSQPLALVANPTISHSAQGGSGAVDWNNLPLVLPLGTTIVRRAIDSYFESLHVKPQVVLEASHPEAVKAVVKATPVAAITHRIAVLDDIHSGDLIELQPAKELPCLTYQLVRPSARDSESTSLLSNFLKEAILEDPHLTERSHRQ